MAMGNSIYLTTYDGTSEQYSLRINRSTNSVKIHGQSSAGVYYGVQTFLSILYSHQDGRLPVLSIDDWPRFTYRGMHLDVARNFHGVQEIKKLVKAMAMYKLNKLHLHLTDDDGWRLEIDGLKELTQVNKHRGSYMSAHVLLNLLSKLGKRDKMRGLPSILSLFRNEFNKFNNTRARMLDSIYHMVLRLL